jgi:selenium metabolism protein YedF
MSESKDLLLIIKASGIGDGEPDLGEKLMESFLRVQLETGHIPDKIIFLNSGIFLTTEVSTILDMLESFEKSGSNILSCGTCLDYYGRKEKLLVGSPTNMKETVDSMMTYKKVIVAP